MARIFDPDSWEEEERQRQKRKEQEEAEAEVKKFLATARRAGFTMSQARFMLNYLSRPGHSHIREFSSHDLIGIQS